MSTQCVITGCAFFDEAHNRWVWGDLHEVTGDDVGGSFVFLANTGVDPLKPDWVYQPLDWSPGKVKIVTAKLGANYFERRGVIVIDADHLAFNDAAVDYIKR